MIIKKILMLCMVGLIILYSMLTMAATTKVARVLEKIMIPKTHFEVGMGIAEFLPFTTKGRHMHSGVEVGYVLAGEIILIVDGQPDKIIKAGESFKTEAYIAHATKAGPDGAKVLATWVVKQGDPVSLNAIRKK